MTKQTRRDFLKSSGIATLGFIGLQQFIAASAAAGTSVGNQVGYGELIPDPAGIINLPKGFTYKIISRQGDKMNDGLLLPGRPDGMGTFKLSTDKTIVIRNHELNPDKPGDGPFGKSNTLLSEVSTSKLYDAGNKKLPGLGGTTTFIYDHKSGKIEKQFLSLAGTVRNCAGGPTPWNSWITCEETTIKVGSFKGAMEKDHGFVFEVPATSEISLADPTPIKAMGRFNHEAVAVDPISGIVYLTEDMGDGVFYRFIPNTPGKLVQGGKLQALAIVGQKSCDTRNWKNQTAPTFPKGQRFAATWIDLEDVASPKDDLRIQAFEKGAARFARAEGIWYGKREIYFACTNGGPNMKGQVFRYIPGINEGKITEAAIPGKLELFIESDDTHLITNCDNLTVSPWGDVVLCEDNDHPFLIGVTPKGECYRLAENVGYESEFAGGVFSPSGDTYFVNIQGPGLTLAIHGPWKKS
jgi:secreted PhoX family phosphatase